MSKKYINNLETGKIELHFTKEEYKALSEDLKKELKRTYLFSRYAQAWVSRSKNNHYSALKVAEKLGFTEEEEQGERLSYEEELNRKAEKAERRIGRYENYSDNAVKRAESLQNDFNSHRGDIAFITQPNINSASGRSFTNYRNKIMNRYNKGFEEYRKSDYFKEKAQASQRTANKTQLKDKVYLCNRTKECDSLIKKYESYIVTVEEKQANGDIEAEKRIKKYLRELEYQIDKKAFMQNCLDELGGIFSKENIKAGYLILIRHGWAKVEKVNTKTVYCKYLEAPLNDWVSKVDYSEIQQIKVPEGFKEEKEEIKNPYKVNDILVTYNISGNRVITAYQVIKVTPKGIQIQKINIENNKPIKDSFTLDKPCRKKVVKSNYNNFIGCYDGDWQLHPYNNNESVAI
ncbi:DUF3560 domain-containing protein [Clostridium sp. CTA-6]